MYYSIIAGTLHGALRSARTLIIDIKNIKPHPARTKLNIFKPAFFLCRSAHRGLSVWSQTERLPGNFPSALVDWNSTRGPRIVDWSDKQEFNQSLGSSFCLLDSMCCLTYLRHEVT
jgi:hypothetical protein